MKNTAFLLVFSLAFAACSSSKKEDETPAKAEVPKTKPCATDAELKSRLEDLPELLVKLGGEHKAVRSYRGRPTDFFEEGHPTACRSMERAGGKKLECPQQFSITLHLPSEPDTKNQPKTFHASVLLLSNQPESHVDLPVDALKGDENELSGSSDGASFFAKAVGKHGKFVYVEWKQGDGNAAAGREQNVLVEIQPSNAQQLRAHVNLQGKGVCGK